MSNRAATGAYSLPDWAPMDSVSAGTNLLISGPPLSGKGQLLADLLVVDGQQTIIVTSDDSADEVRDKLAASNPTIDKASIHVVDCVTHQRRPDAEAGPTTHFVSSPGNLTGIGVGFTEFANAFETTGEPMRVGLTTISQLLMYASLPDVYRFLQVFTGQIQASGWLGVNNLHATVHDEREVQTIETLYDGVIETRTTDDSRELRTRGFGQAPTQWRPF